MTIGALVDPEKNLVGHSLLPPMGPVDRKEFVSQVKKMHLIWIIFFFNDTATTEIYTLSLHDALPICFDLGLLRADLEVEIRHVIFEPGRDWKSARLNSSHTVISYAVFCLNKKKHYKSHRLPTIIETPTPTTNHFAWWC